MGFKQFYLLESGQKLIGYHSTNSKFEAFDHKFTGHVGFYFTPEKYFEHPEHKNSTLDYSKGKKYTLKCELDIKNPIPNDVFVDVMNKAFGGNPRKMAIEQFKKLGYDGYIAKAQIWVFEPEQIKIVDAVDNEINEAPIIDDRYGETAKMPIYTKPEIGGFYTKYKESKLFKKIDNIEMRMLDYIKDEIYLYYVVNGKPAAVLVYKFLDKKAKDFNKYPMVGWMYTTPEYLKKGIQQELHNFLMAYHKGILVDTTLSPEGFKFYKKWAEPFYTYSFDNDDTYSKIKKVDWNKVKSNRHERFVILKNEVDD